MKTERAMDLTFKLVPTGSGFVLMLKNGLHLAHEHLFTIKPDPIAKQIFKVRSIAKAESSRFSSLGKSERAFELHSHYVSTILTTELEMLFPYSCPARKALP